MPPPPPPPLRYQLLNEPCARAANSIRIKLPASNLFFLFFLKNLSPSASASAFADLIKKDPPPLPPLFLALLPRNKERKGLDLVLVRLNCDSMSQLRFFDFIIPFRLNFFLFLSFFNEAPIQVVYRPPSLPPPPPPPPPPTATATAFVRPCPHHSLLIPNYPHVPRDDEFNNYNNRCHHRKMYLVFAEIVDDAR